MIYLIFVLLVFSSICFPKSKTATVLWGVFLGINVICTTLSADVVALEYRYTIHGFSDFPALFRKLMGICAENGLTFPQVKFVYICIVVLLLFFTLHIGTQYPAFCMMLASIYPGWCFSGQIRNTLGAAVVVFGIIYVIKSEYKHKKLVYIVCVILASLLHPACIIYLSILYCLKKQMNISIKVILGVIFLMLVLYSDGLYQIASLFLHDERILKYLKAGFTSNLFGSLMVVGGQLVWTFFAVRQLKKAKNRTIESGGWFSAVQYDLIIRINKVFLILVPFYAINHAIFRIYKYILIINYCFLSEDCYNKRQSSFQVSKFYDGRLIKINNLGTLLLLVFLSLVIQVTVDGGIRDVLKLFENLDFSQIGQIF